MQPGDLPQAGGGRRERLLHGKGAQQSGPVGAELPPVGDEGIHHVTVPRPFGGERFQKGGRPGGVPGVGADAGQRGDQGGGMLALGVAAFEQRARAGQVAGFQQQQRFFLTARDQQHADTKGRGHREGERQAPGEAARRPGGPRR